MTKDFIRLRCPCCKKLLEIDVRNATARTVTVEGKTLDDMLHQHGSESSRLGDAFEAARDQEKKAVERLDDLFRKAKDEAKDDTSKPRNPFELE